MSKEGAASPELTWINYRNPPQQRKEYKSRVRSHASGHFWREKRKAIASHGDGRLKSLPNTSAVQDTASSGETKATWAEPTPEDKSLWRRQRRTSLCIERSLTGLRRVLLDSYPAARHEDILTAVSFCLRVWAPTRFPLHVKLNLPNPYLTKYFPVAVEHAEFLSSQLAISHTLLYANSKSPIEGSNAVLYYRGDAFKRLSAKLQASQGRVDDAMMFTTLGLMHLDVILGEFDALLLHRRGLQHMASLWQGSLDSETDKLIKSTMFHFDQFYSLADPSKPSQVARMSEVHLLYPQTPLNEDFMVTISSYPEGFRDLALQGTINNSLLEVLRRMSQWQNLLTLAQANSADCSQDDLDFVLNYVAFEDVTNIKDCLKLLGKLDSDTISLEQCLCHGLIFYSYNIFNQPRLRSGFEKLDDESLLAITDFLPRTGLERECLIWIWIQTIDSSKIGPRLMPQGEALLEMLLEQYPEAGNVTYLQGLVRKFFWNDMLEDEWRECFEQVIGTKADGGGKLSQAAKEEG